MGVKLRTIAHTYYALFMQKEGWKVVPNYVEISLFIAKVQGFRCIIAQAYGEYAKITELHHRMHFTKTNRKLYPHFINSVFNLSGVNHDWHMKYPYWGTIHHQEAAAIESYLMGFPTVADWAVKPETITDVLINEYNNIKKQFIKGEV